MEEDDGELPEMDMSPPDGPSDESIHADRNLLEEYEKMNPRLQPLPPKTISLDDEEIMRVLDAELPVATPAKEEDDAALLAALDAHDRSEASLSQANAEKETEEDIAKVLAALDADASWGAGAMQGGAARATAPRCCRRRRRGLRCSSSWWRCMRTWLRRPDDCICSGR